LREINDTVLNEDVHFFKVQSRSRRNEGAVGNYRLLGDRNLTTPNEPNGLELFYYLKDQAKEKVTLTVNSGGTTLRTLDGTTKPGINRVVLQLGGFNFQPASDGDSQPRPAASREIPPGDYEITLKVGEKQLKQTARVLP